MMKKVCLIASCFVALCTLLGMGGSPQNIKDYALISEVSITDKAVLNRSKPLTVTFTEDMVEESELNTPVEESAMPFQVVPAVPGKGMWLTTKSFAFTPDKGFPKGKKYVVAFKKDLKSKSGKDVAYLYSFSTAPIRVDFVQIEPRDSSKNTIRLMLRFDDRVEEAALRSHLVVKDMDANKELPCTFKGLTVASSLHVVELPYSESLEKIQVTLRADKDVEDHYLGLRGDYVSELKLAKQAAQVETVTTVNNEPSPITVNSSYIETEENGNIRLICYLNTSLAPEDVSKFISVSPKLPYSISSYGDMITFAEGVEPGQTIEIRLLAGLKDSSNRVLTTERQYTKTIGDRNPAVAFTDPGSYLAPSTGSRVGLRMTNVDQVTVTLHRQYDNNLQFSSLTNSNDYYDGEWEGRNGNYMMTQTFMKEIPLSLKKNELVNRAIDLNAITKGKNGMYRLTVAGYVKTEYGMSYHTSAERMIFLTDIGGTARLFPAGITVFASSISTGKAVPDAEVAIYSASNQLLVEGRTGADGVFVYSGKPWESHLAPHAVVIKKGDDISLLQLHPSTYVELEESAYMSYLDRGYEAAMFTPRGVFRPGETVDIKAFVRDNKQIAPKPFPVMFHVLSSRGLDAAQGSVMLSSEGGAHFSFKLPKSAPSGSYTAKLYIPGKEKAPLGTVSFSVEDFVPPRLEVSLTSPAQILVGNGTLPLKVSGQYLFGAPGAELRYDLGYSVSEASFTPTGYESFAFGDPEVRFDAESNLRYFTGQLDDGGLTSVEFKVPDSWKPQSMLRLNLIAAVQEDGGRWVNKTEQIMYFPTEFMLGLPSMIDGLKPRTLATIPLAAVAADGTGIDVSKVKVELLRVQGTWRTVLRNNRYEYTWSERFIPVTSQDVAVTKGTGSFKITPPDYGQYIIRCSTSDGKITASKRIYAWDGDGSAQIEGAGRMDKVELSFDKPSYRVGDIAKLSVKAPFAGTLYLGVEHSKQLSTRVVTMKDVATVLEIPVTDEMNPNVAVTVWVFRPVEAENKSWFPHRAYGTAALKLSTAPFTLNVKATVAEKIEPNKPVTIPFTVTDEKGAPVAGEFAVAFIDEGVLSLTNFSTPNLLRYFYAQRKKVGESFDIFNLLMRPESRAVTLLKTGGDGASSYYGSLSTDLVYLMEFLPTVMTDESGRGEAVFSVPEYSGKGRLMIVGASGRRFASEASSVRIARDIVAEVTAPKVVAPGDTFDVTINTFTVNPSLVGKASVSVKTTGPLEVNGKKDFTIAIDGSKKAKGERAVLKVAALKENAIATLDVTVSFPGRDDLTFTKSLQVAVRSPFPRTSAVVTELISGNSSATLELPSTWVKGSTKLALTVGKSPVFSVLPALEYLREYPYGCLEQLTSRAWPYLVLPTIEKALLGESKTKHEQVLGEIVTRIAAMQVSDGGFSMWPGGNTADIWKSINAAFFLMEAKAHVTIPKSTLDKTLGYVKLILQLPDSYFVTSEFGNTVKAYAAFVLTRAGEKPVSWLQVLSKQEKNMYPSGRIFLAAAKALHAGNPAALLELKNTELSKKAQLGMNDSLESDYRNLSLRLMAWSLVAPTHEETQRLCKQLAEATSKKGWFTTQEAGMASLAFGRYLEKTGVQGQTVDVDVLVDNQTLASVANVESLILSTDDLPIKSDGAPEKITIRAKNGGQAYAVYSVRGVPSKAPKAMSSGIEVSRSWEVNGSLIDMSTNKIELQKGDRITVTLTVNADYPVSQLVLSDVLPGGVEVENARLQQIRDEGEQEYSDEENAATPYQPSVYLDLREDRVLVFYSYATGRATYSYTMRAVTPGTYVLPPVAAEGMYSPDVSAITGTGTLVIK